MAHILGIIFFMILIGASVIGLGIGMSSLIRKRRQRDAERKADKKDS